MNIIDINKLLDIQSTEEMSKINLHFTPTINTSKIDIDGLSASIGVHSKGPNGNEKTKKVFFTQGLQEGYLVLVNRMFAIFRGGLLSPKTFGQDKYAVIKGIDKEEINENTLEQKEFLEEFWRTDEVMALGLSKDTTVQEALIEFGLRKFSEDYCVEYEDLKKMYGLLIKNNVEKEDFLPEKLSPSIKASLFSLIAQSMKNHSLYKLDLQEGVDYVDTDQDEEKNDGKPMPKYNMHTLSGRGIEPQKIHRIVSDGKCMSMYEITKLLCHKYIQMYPEQDFPTIINTTPEGQQWTDDNWLRDFFVQYMKLEKSGLEDCMQDDGIRISTEQMATRTIRDAALGRNENSREEEKDIGE